MKTARRLESGPLEGRAAPARARSAAASAALAAAGGLMIAVSFLWFSLWAFAWIAFVPIIVALAWCGSLRHAAGVGFLAGLVTNVPAFYWLV
ncbi:MAG: hypothetical protein ACREQ9_22075, partial [Candidatus Binatia bacterium]